MPPNFFETPLTSSTVPVALSGIRNEGSGKPWWILRWLMAAASSDAGQKSSLQRGPDSDQAGG